MEAQVALKNWGGKGKKNYSDTQKQMEAEMALKGVLNTTNYNYNSKSVLTNNEGNIIHKPKIKNENQKQIRSTKTQQIQ